MNCKKHPIKIYYLLLLLIVLIGYSCSEGIDFEIRQQDINVISGKGFFSRDYRRYVVIEDVEGVILSKMRLRDDVNGCVAFLFDSVDEFLLFDCDGSCYSINKETSSVQFLKQFQPNDILPEKYLGSYELEKNTSNYYFNEHSKLDRNKLFFYGGNTQYTP